MMEDEEAVSAKPLADQLADGELTPFEASNQLQLVTAMEKTLKERDKLLRGFLLDNLNEHESLKGAIGSVTQKNGGETKWAVKDAEAYAEWLLAHDKGSMVRTANMPVSDACDPGYLKALCKESDGEIPDGVDPPKGRADSVTVKVDKDWQSKIDRLNLTGKSAELLGITDQPQPDRQGTTEEHDNNKENDVWATV